jgi:antitoxin component YwqK of YwqJK toxin-antitoxin module
MRIRDSQWAVGIMAVVLMGGMAWADEEAAIALRLANSVEGSPTLAPPRNSAQPAVASATAEGVIDMGKVEQVAERYPNGKTKVEREVGQDAKGNYVNQGSYKMYGLDGEVIKSGDFLNGKQHGKWTQRFTKDEGHLFSAGDNDFQGPFVSEATFLDGHLHGIWTIKDRNGQSIVEWNFDEGTRTGTWTWWHSNAQKRLEATFRNGVLNDDVQEWDHDGKLVNHNTYIDGKCLVKAVGWYTLGQKHYDGYYLRVESMAEPAYDWWNSKVTTATEAPTGPDQKHGTWTAWYRNGNKESEGQYDHDLPIGKFSWWYENGQKQAEGDYDNGKKTGVWTTWHSNGLKEAQGEYKDGKLTNKWMRWDADGKLVEGNEPQKLQRPTQAPVAGLQNRPQNQNAYQYPRPQSTGQRPVQSR